MISHSHQRRSWIAYAQDNSVGANSSPAIVHHTDVHRLGPGRAQARAAHEIHPGNPHPRALEPAVPWSSPSFRDEPLLRLSA
jgi:hypothetical protein